LVASSPVHRGVRARIQFKAEQNNQPGFANVTEAADCYARLLPSFEKT